MFPMIKFNESLINIDIFVILFLKNSRTSFILGINVSVKDTLVLMVHMEVQVFQVFRATREVWDHRVHLAHMVLQVEK